MKTKASKITEVIAKLDGIEEVMYECHHFVDGNYGPHDSPSGVWIICRNHTVRIMHPCKNHLSRYLTSGNWETYEP